MSAWRREASTRLPELQHLIASREVTSPMSLWLALREEFDRGCARELPNLDLLRRIWAYAAWCMARADPRSPDSTDEVGTAAALGFCEHLLDDPRTATVLPDVMTSEDFRGLRSLLLYHNDETAYATALARFGRPRRP